MKDKKFFIIIAGVIIVIVGLIIFLLGGKTTEKYTISFDTAGGTIFNSLTVEKGSLIGSIEKPIKAGFKFLYWESNGKKVNDSDVIESDMKLTAVWEMEEPEAQKHVVTFNVEGQTKTLEVSEITEDDLLSLGFEKREGYQINWYLDDKPYDLSTPLTEDVSLTGKYEKITSYTVKFDTAGGSSVPTQTVNVGDSVVEPTNVTKEGYILEGWYLNDQKYDFTEEVKDNITLIANWLEDPNIVKYTIKFDSDGGSSVPTQTVVENKTATKPENPTKKGYAFEGWYLVNIEYNFKEKVTSDLTLIAKWRELAKFTVTFDSADGGNVDNQIVIEGETVIKPQDPVNTGYTFKGWM